MSMGDELKPENPLDIADRAYYAGKAAGIAEAAEIAKMQKPVAWRHNHFGTWHYMGENDPFPPDGWEPLYLRSSE